MAFLLFSIAPVFLLAFDGLSGSLPTLDQAIASKDDLWGDAAMRQTNGASYDFFEPLLPPLRYINADFHYYPIVLSAPNASLKARLISNGSGVNLSGGARSWREIGTPVIFRVGQDELRFGEIPTRLEHPTLAQGYLPIPRLSMPMARRSISSKHLRAPSLPSPRIALSLSNSLLLAARMESLRLNPIPNH